MTPSDARAALSWGSGKTRSNGNGNRNGNVKVLYILGFQAF